MIQGLTLQQLGSTLEAQRNAKKDYIVNTAGMTYTPNATFGSIGFNVQGGSAEFAVTEHCLKQVCETFGIPYSYVQKMKGAELFSLIGNNVQTWLKMQPQKRLVRTYRGLGPEDVARAFLSDRYRPLDNYDLADAILPTLMREGVEVKSCNVDDRKLYIQAVSNVITGEVKKGDVVQAGVVISNSEVGDGSLRVEPMIYRLVCTNGMIGGFALRQNHVGRRHGGNGDGEFQDASEFFSDETREADDKALWMKVRDTARAALDHALFTRLVEKMRLATEVDLSGHVDTVAEVVTERFKLSESERSGFLSHLASGGDVSQYGVVNAITRTAQDAERYERAIELERFGGMALELKRQDFLRAN